MLKKFEHYIFNFLIGIIAVYILVEIVTLSIFFIRALISIDTKDFLFINNEEGAKILPTFFSILISMELIDTLRIYMKENTIKSQHIITIGIIAIARKLIVLDFAHGDPMVNISISALIITLALAFYFIKKAERMG